MTQQYNFPDHITGTTFNGVQFTIKVNGAPINITDVSITFIGLKGTYQMGSGGNGSGSGITITDAANGVFKIDNQIINWKVGDYTCNIITTRSNGDKKAYIKGKWKIIG